MTYNRRAFREATELGELIPDLQEKIEESKQLESERSKAELEAALMIRGAFQSALSSFTAPLEPAAASVPIARDLGSLVRKRPAATPDVAPGDNDCKKIKPTTLNEVSLQ